MAKGFHANGTPVNRISKSEFLQRSAVKHNGKYDYSLADYNGNTNTVQIICPKHGVFAQRAADHLAGCGCRKCAGNNYMLTKEEFIERATLVHQGAYDYSKTEYKGAATKILIICALHGEFLQIPNSHLNKRGCPECGAAIVRERNKLHWLDKAGSNKSYLYFVRVFNESECFYKVGVTVTTVQKRFKTGALANYQYEILAIHESDAARVWGWEQSILATFAHLSHKPKVGFKGDTECFSSADEILAIFPL